MTKRLARGIKFPRGAAHAVHRIFSIGVDCHPRRFHLVRWLPRINMFAAAFVPHVAGRDWETTVYRRRNKTAHSPRILVTFGKAPECHRGQRPRECHARRSLHLACSHRLNAEKQSENSHGRALVAFVLLFFFDCAGTPIGVMLLRGLGLVFRPALTAAKKRRCASSSLY